MYLLHAINAHLWFLSDNLLIFCCQFILFSFHVLHLPSVLKVRWTSVEWNIIWKFQLLILWFLIQHENRIRIEFIYLIWFWRGKIYRQKWLRVRTLKIKLPFFFHNVSLSYYLYVLFYAIGNLLFIGFQQLLQLDISPFNFSW